MKALLSLLRAVPWPLRLLLLAGALWALGYYALPRCVPLPPALLNPVASGRVYLASDGTPLRHLLNENGQRASDEVTMAEVPEMLRFATLAAEDKRFFNHGGIDFLATARAVVENLKSGRVVSGASTITQQLIKITRGPQPRTWQAKIMEALQARHLEQVWSKDQILGAYLTRLSYGNLFTGCRVASQGYFRKPLKDLTAAEAAFLAGLPQAPWTLEPFSQHGTCSQAAAMGALAHAAGGLVDG